MDPKNTIFIEIGEGYDIDEVKGELKEWLADYNTDDVGKTDAGFRLALGAGAGAGEPPEA